MGKTIRHPPKKRSIPNGRQKTRSHGATLLTPSDPARSERELASQLKMMGLYAHNTIGDGNCLFRALSDQLYGTPKEHWALRREICDHLLANPDRYEFFVDDDRPFADHVRVMRENGTYGGHLELTAFAHLKKRWIKVVQPGLVYVVSCEDESRAASTSTSSSSRRKGKGPATPEDEDGGAGPNKDDPDEGSTCYLAYHNWEHWSSVRNINGPHTGPPKVREIPRASASRPSSPSPTPPPPLSSTDPSPFETLVLNSLPPNSFSLETIRSTISSLGGIDAVSWEGVTEVLLERQEEFVEGVSPVKRLDFLKRREGDWRSASPVSSSSGGGRGGGSGGGEEDGDPAEILSASMSTAKTLKPTKALGSLTPTSSFSSQDSSPSSTHSSPASPPPPPPTPPPNPQTTKLRFKRPPPGSPTVVVAGKEKRAARKRRVSAAKLTGTAAGAKDGRVTRSRVGVAEESVPMVGGGRGVEGGFRELFI
ncbi:hypothetical protein BDY24DRAFT_393647 [Mrakia frigida]|uniref:OTU domain-containing protein n=1 Tax=Mrakia frigida TaxID=29902 RepID=UPI003FCC097C